MHGSFSSSLEDMPEFKFLRRLKRCKFIRRDLVISKQPSFWSNNFCPQIIVQMVQFILKKKHQAVRQLLRLNSCEAKLHPALVGSMLALLLARLPHRSRRQGEPSAENEGLETQKMEVGKVICLFNQAGWWFQKLFIFSPIWGRFSFWLIFFKGVETAN